MIEGELGEFTVSVDNTIVAKKGWFRFPPLEKIVEGVKAGLNK